MTLKNSPEWVTFQAEITVQRPVGAQRMVMDYIGLAVIFLVYLCLFIIVFSPTLYAVWFYFISRQVSVKRKGLLRIALTTFCINLIVAYFLIHLAFDYFLVSKVAEKDAVAQQTVASAVASEKKFFADRGWYYSVGPVRGPYENDRGLKVPKDVILEIVPKRNKSTGKENFDAYAFHVWGGSLIIASNDGKVERAPKNSLEDLNIHERLLKSR